MLIALVGVTGVGKSYYKEKIVEELNFKKVNTIRTRKIRKNEINGTSGLFLSSEELDELEKQGKLAYRFSVFGGEYAYLKEEIFTKENMIFEMHYTTIFDWKRIVPDIKTIYILPNDIDYSLIGGLRLEARQKLNKIKPDSIGQASRISGVSPADISVLLVYLEQRKYKENEG